MNEVISVVTSGDNSYPGISKMNKGIFKFNGAKKGGVEVISYPGIFFSSMAKILVACLWIVGNVQEEEVSLMTDLIGILAKIKYEKNFSTVEKQKELAKQIFNFKKKCIKVFPPGEFNYHFVNFDTLDIWPSVLSYLGPATLYSGEIWEASCQTLRRNKIGNNHEPERDALEKEALQKALQWTTEETGKTRRLKLDFGKKQVFRIIGDAERISLNACLDAYEIEKIGLENLKKIDSAKLNGLNIYSETSFISFNFQEQERFARFKYFVERRRYRS